MKKVYNSPIVESAALVKGGILCESNGNSGTLTNPGETPGGHTDAPRRRIF